MIPSVKRLVCQRRESVNTEHKYEGSVEKKPHHILVSHDHLVIHRVARPAPRHRLVVIPVLLAKVTLPEYLELRRLGRRFVVSLMRSAVSPVLRVGDDTYVRSSWSVLCRVSGVGCLWCADHSRAPHRRHEMAIRVPWRCHGTGSYSIG